jgi:hypothetical protein
LEENSVENNNLETPLITEVRFWCIFMKCYLLFEKTVN